MSHFICTTWLYCELQKKREKSQGLWPTCLSYSNSVAMRIMGKKKKDNAALCIVRRLSHWLNFQSLVSEVNKSRRELLCLTPVYRRSHFELTKFRRSLLNWCLCQGKSTSCIRVDEWTAWLAWYFSSSASIDLISIQATFCHCCGRFKAHQAMVHQHL